MSGAQTTTEGMWLNQVNTMKTIITLLLIFIQSICFAQVYEKGGFPCVAEICIGDGLSELKNVEWDPVFKKMYSAKERDNYLANGKLEAINNRYRGNISKDAALYLDSERFDSKSLSLLTEISALCGDGGYLKGNYKTKGGNDTQVSIRLLPNSQGSNEQQWTVVHIRRFVSTPMNKQDIKAAEKELSERYKAFNTVDEKGYQKTKPTEKGAFTFNDFTSYFTFDLEYSSEDYNRFRKTNRLPPQCTKKINID